jgi:bla regulator protein BlaR1
MTIHAIESFCKSAAPLAANHLWQSTLFAAAVAGVASAFRKYDARMRFGLWMAASLKFLIPFAWLIALGNRLAQIHPSTGSPAGIYAVVEQVGQPFHQAVQPTDPAGYWLLLPAIVAALWLLGTLAVLCSWAVRWGRISALVRHAEPMIQGREIDALRRLQQVIGIDKPVPLLLSHGPMEPGIFGIFRPALLLPEGITEHLSEDHLQAILAHELWHVRRRDNLAAALHMFVEAAFWFHPLVWWIGAKLLEERERVCDEEVLRLGGQPEIYAESLLKACRFCVETPLSCVSGVAGSNLKRRVTRIMNFQSATHLTLGRKVLLTAMALAAPTGPVVFGAMHAPQLNAQTTYTASMSKQSFEVASLRPSRSQDCLDRVEVQPGRFTATCVTAKRLIEYAYGIDGYQLTGGPDWAGTDRYDVEATWKESAALATALPAGPPPPPSPAPGMIAMRAGRLQPGQLQAMVISLLAERFNLQLKSESQNLPIYDLVVASSGAKLAQTPVTPPPPSFNGEAIIGVKTLITKQANEVTVTNGPVSALAGFLSQMLNRKVVDKTGLKGPYDITLRLTRGQDATAGLSDSMQEQLGLRLQSGEAPVSTFMIEQIDKPAEN